VNNISNGFSLSNSWFIIKNPNKFFYDNPSQADRLERSSVALKIAELLSQAKIYTYTNINKDDNMVSDEQMLELMSLHDKMDITTWLSNEFKTLYNKINDSIDHTKENIIM